jgi:hypothetical protein
MAVVCCIEARSVRLQDLDFDRKQLKVVQGRKDQYKFPTIFIEIHQSKTPRLPFNGQPFS